MKKYVIINTSEVSSINFNEVLQTSANTLRYSLDNSKAIVKFEGNTPSFLNGKTQYTQEEILRIVQTDDWSADE
jgi:hypothetical protein|tara:strand:- start:329 stop:550 length:222 start_codon:yes stop_codon:yes gene_type:complete